MTAPFKHRCVQDLAWVIQSPPLISGHIAGVNWWSAVWYEDEYQACLPGLQELDADPQPLLQALQQAKSARLGHYFEALVAFWLQISPNFECLVHSYALRTAGKTLGELDFVLRDLRRGVVIHMEVAVKFYLGRGELNTMGNWYGPGLHDRLDLKYQRLCEHQTQLAVKYPEWMPYEVDERVCMVKGRLFYPPGTSPETDFAAPGHLHGYWQQWPVRVASKVLPLAKRDWLAVHNRVEAEHEQCIRLTHTPPEARCFALVEQGQETARFFLLPENFWRPVKA